MTDTINLTFPESKCERIEIKGVSFITVDTGMTAEELILMLLKYDGGKEEAMGFAVLSEEKSNKVKKDKNDFLDDDDEYFSGDDEE